jgi:hypothetical protein
MSSMTHKEKQLSQEGDHGVRNAWLLNMAASLFDVEYFARTPQEHRVMSHPTRVASGGVGFLHMLHDTHNNDYQSPGRVDIASFVKELFIWIYFPARIKPIRGSGRHRDSLN